MREACATEYPRLMHDIKTPPTERGLLSFVSDQIFELNVLKKEETEMADEDLAAKDPAPVNDVEKRADPEDDTVGEISLLPKTQPFVTNNIASTIPL